MRDFVSIVDTELIVSNLGLVAVAYILTLPVAWDRETNARSAGLRTFPLVAIASCGFVLLGVQLTGGDNAGLSRVIQGLMTGIGFIGGGAILKNGHSVRGTATAASIWTTGAIGAATALGHFEIALVLGIANFVTLRVMAPLKGELEREQER